MATKTILQEGGIIVAEWTLTSGDPIGTELVLPYHTDMCVTCEGTIGDATVQIEGKNHPVVATGSWLPLSDLQGNALTRATTAVPFIEQVQEAPYMVRPELSVPGTTGNVTVRIKATRSR